jgi:murein DD-endopeptidase MepM/ murein hydrolase activator NlpD
MTMRLAHEGDRKMTCDQECHHARGSRGGEDYAMPVGTPLYAPAAGMARARTAGTGGWTVTITRPNGDTIELMHCSAFVGMRLGGPAVAVLTGQRVALSGGRRGAPGAGSSTGPHSHQHADVDGIRIGLSQYIGGAPTITPAGGTGTTINDQESIEMLIIQVKAGTVTTPRLVHLAPLIAEGQTYLLGESGRLRLVDQKEVSAWVYAGAKTAPWNPNDVADHIFRNGLLEYEGTPSAPDRLTGRVIDGAGRR